MVIDEKHNTSMTSQPDKGILYFAKGDIFIDEAIKSASRIKRIMPRCPITIVADDYPCNTCFDNVIIDESPFVKADKPRAMQQSPYNRTLFLDTDIFVEEPVWELFDMLDNFEMAMCLNREVTCREIEEDSISKGVPPATPEFNTGVIVYKDTASVASMLSDWETRCQPDHEMDQWTFRSALYHSNVSFCPITNQYNCMYRNDNTVDGKVKVFHGPLVDREENRIDLNSARELLNNDDGLRVHRKYMDSLLINPKPPLTTRIPRMIHRFYALWRDEGIKNTLQRTIRYLS